MKKNSSWHKHKPVALITGASSGIGLELARVFAREGYNLVLVARNEPALKQLATECAKEFGTEAFVLPADLSKPQAANRVHRLVTKKKITLDVLVNDAGFGNFGRFAENDPNKEHDLIQVNIASLTSLTRLFATEMVNRGRGKILNVASTAAYQPGPMMATYYASKAYILSFSEALARELKDTGVSVSCLCPGPTLTKFQERAHMGDVHLAKRTLMMEAAPVAEIAYRGLMRKKRVIVPGLLNKIGTIVVRMVPRALTMSIVHFLHRPAR
jgi:short-subunit dehydrogenase